MLKQLGHKLGLTKETRTELSDIFCEEGIITSDHYWEEELNKNGMPKVYADDDLYVGIIGEKTRFKIEHEILGDIKIGDKVKISYREEFGRVFDYIPPNFDQKQDVGIEFKKYSVVNAEKI